MQNKSLKLSNKTIKTLEKLFDSKDKVKIHPPLVNDGLYDHLKIMNKTEMRKKLKK